MSADATVAGLDDPFMAQYVAQLAGSARSDDERRLARIGAEAMHAFRELAHVRKAVSIFGSAQREPAERWGSLAMKTAELMARDGFAVITGGGPGLMEAANAGAHAGGGNSIGLTIHLPLLDEPRNEHVLLPVPFHYFFLRKLAFVRYSCAFVCLPGGYGTLDELFEALNLKRTHRIEPFPVILLGSRYWTGLYDWLREVAVPEGTLSAEDLELIEVLDDPEEAAQRIRISHAELCLRLGLAGE